MPKRNDVRVWPPRRSGVIEWRTWRGATGRYAGQVVELGVGVPRRSRSEAPSWGLRRALYDAAFGYVSGFPLIDIATFTLRSLVPSRTMTVTITHDTSSPASTQTATQPSRTTGKRPSSTPITARTSVNHA